MKKFWLVKQEPSAYSWANFVADRKTAWTGVRNYTARNNLRSMRKGDAVLFYHSVTDKAVVGIAKVIREAYPDTTASEGDWSAVDLAPEKYVKRDSGLERPNEPARLVGSSAKIQRVLGWNRRTQFRDLVREMVEAELAAIGSA